MKRIDFTPNKDTLAMASRRRVALRTHQIVDRLPLFFGIDVGEVAPGLAMDEQAEHPEKAAELQAIYAKARLDAFPEGDSIPSLNTAFLGEGLIPSMFGAEQVPNEKNPPYTRGRVIQDLERDLHKMPERIYPEHDGWGPRLKRAVDAWMDITQGDLPVSNCDVQSPYGLATKLMPNEDLMLACYDAPELVHELMARVTQATIDTVAAMRRWAGDALQLNPDDPIPGGGTIIYDDYASVVSPKLHGEFCLPYNKRLFEAHGKGHLHTCGPYFEGYIDAMLRCEPATLDISAMRGLTRTKADVKRLREITWKHGITLVGGLATNDVSVCLGSTWVEPDEEFIRYMARGNMLMFCDGGSREKGLRRIALLEDIAREGA